MGKIDQDASGTLDKKELGTLLRFCTGEEPDEGSVNELMTRMGGNEQRVHKEDLVSFLASLQQLTAQDRAVNDSSSESGDSDSELGNRSRPCLRCFDGGRPDSYSIAPRETSRDLVFEGAGFHRQAPNFCSQFLTILNRRAVQLFRQNWRRSLDIALVLVCAFIIALLARDKMEIGHRDVTGSLLFAHLGLSLAVTTSCLRVFSQDQPVFWRESSSGINVFAFFCARTFLDMFDWILQTFLYTALFFMIARPAAPFEAFMIPTLLLSYVVSGYSYLVSTFVPAKNSLIAGIVLVLILCGILGDPRRADSFMSNNSQKLSLRFRRSAGPSSCPSSGCLRRDRKPVVI